MVPAASGCRIRSLALGTRMWRSRTSTAIGDGTPGSTATAAVNMTVTAVNDPPSAAADAATVAEDSGATAISVLGNDSFAPDVGETLSIVSVNTTGTQGSVTIKGGGTGLT